MNHEPNRMGPEGVEPGREDLGENRLVGFLIYWRANAMAGFGDDGGFSLAAADEGSGVGEGAELVGQGNGGKSEDG